MARSTSPQEDERREQATPSRMANTHGGKTVQSVAPEDLEPMNDADCKHEKLIRDPTETDFIAFVCANEKCNEVVLFDKT